MTISRGDVVLVPFDFTKGTGGKWRPALVVSSKVYHKESPDLVLASVTGNMNALPHPGDYKVVNWKRAGLLRPSMVQMKLATVEKSMVGKKLGSLPPEEMAVVNEGLLRALELWQAPTT